MIANLKKEIIEYNCHYFIVNLDFIYPLDVAGGRLAAHYDFVRN